MSGKTLVTGATGFIGSHVLRQLVEKGEEVVILTRESSSRLNLAGLEFEERHADLTDATSVLRALEGCSRVYHVAGHIATARREAERVYDANWRSTKNVFDACKTTGVERVLYLASIFAIGGGRPVPFKEDDPYNLDALGIDYFDAKRKAELEAYRMVDAGVPIVFVYPCYCFGAGDVYVSSSRPLLSLINGEIPAYIEGGINAMDVRDCAAGLILGMEKGEIGRKYLIGGENLTWTQFFTKAAALAGVRRPGVKLPRSVAAAVGGLLERVVAKPTIDRASAEIMGRYWFYDDTRARSELGYVSRPVEEAFAEGIRWFASHGYIKANRRRGLKPEFETGV